jgi:hypothetical protein
MPLIDRNHRHAGYFAFQPVLKMPQFGSHPVPPNALLGSLLVVAMSVGYIAVGRALA